MKKKVMENFSMIFLISLLTLMSRMCANVVYCVITDRERKKNSIVLIKYFEWRRFLPRVNAITTEKKMKTSTALMIVSECWRFISGYYAPASEKTPIWCGIDKECNSLNIDLIRKSIGSRKMCYACVVYSSNDNYISHGHGENHN